jgi:peptidoglycan/LPS O-acetylase OafA/YrhL
LTRLPERNLDVLRAVAVLCVLANHVGLLLHANGGWLTLATQIGNAGVLLFFVHTSLVLMASLERQGSDRHWIAVFYLRRALRIYPLAIATVLLVVAAAMPRQLPAIGVHAASTTWPASVVLANVALVQNLLGLQDVLGPLWSLPVEVDMYLLLPFCYLIARRPRSRDLGALFVAFVAAYLITSSSALSGGWRLNVFQFGPCFFGGVLAYHLLRIRQRSTLPSWTLGIVLALAVVAVPMLHPIVPPDLKNWIPCLFLGAVVPGITELAPSIITSMGKTIAKYSYGIYLLHVPVFWFAFDVCRALPIAAQILIALIGLAVIPWLGYHTIEQPAIRLGQHLTHRRLTLAATQPAP